MKRHLIATLLISFFAIPVVHAETVHLGVMYGQMDTDKSTTDNLGLVIGGYRDSAGSGLGLEFFYSHTYDEDSERVSGLKVDVSVNAYGISGVYKTPTMPSWEDQAFRPYLKGQVGIAVVNVTLDYGADGSISDSETGLSYGIAVGAPLGNGNVELSYTVLPEFDDFKGADVDTDVEMIAISYLWNF